jgi:hypothetical protein
MREFMSLVWSKQRLLVKREWKFGQNAHKMVFGAMQLHVGPKLMPKQVSATVPCPCPMTQSEIFKPKTRQIEAVLL